MNSKSNGFSLIETLIALVILSVSLLALASLMATVTKTNSYGGHMTEASTFAQDKLEELRAIRWESIPAGSTEDWKTGSTGISFARNWIVTQTGNLKNITISINWNDRTDHSVRLISVVTQ